MPYTETEDADIIDDITDNSHSKANTRRHSPQAARYNHAIWDQIGLLHWIRRNVHSFGGDPANVTLAAAAADSRASLHLQLLCMSPLAKGKPASEQAIR